MSLKLAPVAKLQEIYLRLGALGNKLLKEIRFHWTERKKNRFLCKESVAFLKQIIV